MQKLCEYRSPLGRIILAENGGAITGLWFEGQKYFPEKLDGVFVNPDDSAMLKAAVNWLDRYFAGDAPSISELKLAPNGSEFQRRVWQKLCEIPHGEVRTYGDIGKALAAESGKDRMSAQAVGGAVGHNPISLIIPCHRVVGADGSLTGYAGGVDRKMALLKLEKVDITKLSAPKKGTAL